MLILSFRYLYKIKIRNIISTLSKKKIDFFYIKCFSLSVLKQNICLRMPKNCELA